MIKGLRRSLKGEKRASAGSQGNGSIRQKSNIATVPPKKIIKALYDYDSQGPGELSFAKGDFLYVTGNENHPDWYEACDPPSNMSGMVPVSYFEVVSRNETIPTVPLNPGADSKATMKKDSGYHDVEQNGNHVSHQHKPSTSSMRLSSGKPQTALYGVVMYDFDAERPDELQATAGESLIIIAQSNEEWFVAKPIGRLGGPGLIPISFIQVREVGSDKAVDSVEEAILKAGVPKVEEWKRMAAEYKASSIPLGRFDDVQAGNSVSSQMKTMSLNGENGGHNIPSGATLSTVKSAGTSNAAVPVVIAASVDRYAYDGLRYWYLVIAELSNGRFRNLCRYYQDFYDFQIQLLDEFPDEAGRTGKQRTLPFMPGPLTYVNDSISSQRRSSLDNYVRSLIQMPTYISQSPIVQQLFALRAGDIETNQPTTAMPQPPNIDPSTLQSQQSGTAQQTNGHHNVPAQQYSDAQTDAQQPTVDSQPRGSDTTLSNHSYVSHEDNNINSTVSLSQSAYTHHGSLSNVSVPHTTREDDVNRAETYVKVKVFHEDDLIAIRVPSSIKFDNLIDRISERLNLKTMTLFLRDETTGNLTQLVSDEDFASALGTRTKLVLCAK